jgi:MATE family multidrug resistance protein
VCAGNGATALQSGILHGCARQKTGALVNGIANYGFGLPAMLLLAFYFREGAAGLWWGITASTFLQAAILQTLITRFDWQAEAERAARLVHHLSSGHLLTAAFSGELVAAHSAEAVAPLRVRGL